MKFRLTGAGRKTILSQFLKLNFSIPTIEECAMTTYVFQKVKWPFFHMHTMYTQTLQLHSPCTVADIFTNGTNSGHFF